MRNLLTTLTVIAALACCAAFTLPSTATPKARTCAAFRAWEHHRTRTGLNTMLTDSEQVPWHPLAVDVVVVYVDIRDHDTTDLPGDIAGIRADCK